MKKIKRIFLSLIYVIVGFFTSFTSYAVINPQPDMYGPPLPPPTVTDLITKRLVILLAIPLILIIGIIVFIVKKRKNKKNKNLTKEIGKK